MTQLSQVWPLLLGLMAGLFLYLKGRVDGQSRVGRKRQSEALKTHERINDAPIATTLASARAWLAAHSDRLRGKRRS